MNADERRSDLRSSAAKILSPTAINLTCDVVADNEFVRKTGLGARIDYDRRRVHEMMALDGCAQGVDICGRFEASPGGPKEIRCGTGDAYIVVQDDQGPICKCRVVGDARWQ